MKLGRIILIGLSIFFGGVALIFVGIYWVLIELDYRWYGE